ncbi:hypothetical protein [Vibrio variabilis]|uniref:hypothetical protein n=1 Tax=Vibrio variabilis TaxID=990271 RepID=UPI000DD936EC|nr:hypothetical protein [Vibrio variabilis]
MRHYGQQIVDDADTGAWDWTGPYEHDGVMHLVRVLKFTPELLPPLEDIEGKVFMDWRQEHNLAFKRDYEQQLLEQYRSSAFEGDAE